MFPGIKTQTQLSQGAHILSDAVTLLGSLASISLHRSSQAERQLNKLHASLRHFTRYATVDERNSVFNYGEARFWGQPTFAHLEPGVQRIVEGYVTRAKAA